MPHNGDSFDQEDVNPFATEPGPGIKSQLPSLRSEPSGFNKHDATVDVPLGSSNKKMRDIAAWEAELKKREQDLKRREDALNNTGFKFEEKNWPPLFPIIHHDIAKEIPIHAQKMQYLAFASWLGINICLIYNIVAVMVCSINGGGVKIFLLAAIYALSGCPLSYVMWYRPLYNAMRTDSMLHFGTFFLAYMFHTGFCILAAIAPPIVFEGKSLTGFIAALDTLTGSLLVGIFYLIGSCLFSLESLLSVLVLQRYSRYITEEGVSRNLKESMLTSEATSEGSMSQKLTDHFSFFMYKL